MGLNKGELAEEILRNYFSDLGYFVVRGVPLFHNNTEITDIDLWLYLKSSPFTRERINVDIKNKKSPQALERILWAKGLQNILETDRCIVATTDNRDDVIEFGKLHNVIVLDGNFMQRISIKNDKGRLSEEDLQNIILPSKDNELFSENMKNIYNNLKGMLLNQLDFNGANKYLIIIKKLLEKYIINNNEATLRLIYLAFSYYLICLDYIMKDIISKDEDKRRDEINKNIRFGKNGISRIKEVTAYIELALPSIESSFVSKDSNIEKILLEVSGTIKSEILAEYFSKNINSSLLFENAIQYEKYAYQNDIIEPTNLPTNLKGIIGLISDFHSIERKKIFG